MGESLILRFYDFFNGQPVSIEQLIAYRQKVENYVDSIGSGEYVPKLSAIKTQVTRVIKDWQAKGITDVDSLELVNNPKPTLSAPPPAAFAAMAERGTLWPSKRKDPTNKMPDKKATVVVKEVVKQVEKIPDNVVALDLPISQIHTDTKRFQNRQGAFSEASAQSVAENYDPNKFDPIVVWKDPKAKKLFVLSGHSRLEGMIRRKSKTIAVRYFKGSEDKAIQFAKVEANRAANQENLIEDLAAYKLMRDGDAKRKISKATKGELSKIFKGKAAKLESYSFLSERGLFVEALNQSSTSNYPYIERNAQWVGILRMQYPVISNQGEDNIFHFFYSDKSGKNIKLTKDLFFALAKKKINQLRKGESVLFPECSSEGCKQTVDKESDAQKGEGYKRLREINEQLESITEKLTSKDATVRVTTDQEKKYLRDIGEKLNVEKERILRDFDLLDKSQNSLFGLGKISDLPFIKAIVTKEGNHYFPLKSGVKLIRKSITPKKGEWYLAMGDIGSPQWLRKNEFELVNKNQNINGPQIDAFNIEPKKKKRSPLNELQMAQLQDAIKAGRTPKVNLKAKMNATKKPAPLFDEPVNNPRQASLFGRVGSWEDDKGNLITGNVIDESDRFYTVEVLNSSMKRKNYKPIKKGEKYLVNKSDLQFDQQKPKTLSGIDYTYTPIPLGPYQKDFERLFSDTVVGIYGLPGHGKTTYLLVLAQYLATQGKKVLFVAREEYGRSEFDIKLKEHNIGHPNLTFNKQLEANELKAADVVFLDSVNALKLDASGVEKIYHQYQNKLWFLILQSIKSGNFRGSQEWEHVVSVFGEIQNRKLILRKNRLDPNNSAKAAELQKTNAITEAKKKAEVKEAVKTAMAKPTPPTTNNQQPTTIVQPIAA
jgi:hypothetical protein